MSFSPKQFRDALQDFSKLAQKMEKYLQDVRKHNVEIMYNMLQELYKIINEKQSPIVKVNAMFALKMTLQTCQYPMVEMTQAFLLPVIQEIALYHSDKRTYGKTSQFFKDKGFSGSIPNLEQLSHNYVDLATKIVLMGGAIKQNGYFYTDALKTPSAFKSLAKKLKDKKVDIPPQYENYEWRQRYQAKLNIFGTTQDYELSYINLFRSKVEKYLIEGAKGRDAMDFRKLLKNGDSWLNSQILGGLNESLNDDNFQVRRLALGLLHQLFLSGDIEAVMIVNQGEVVERIVERIMEVKGSSDLGRGAQIYPQVAGQMEIKKNFYIQFLRCIDTWARLVPTAIYLNQQQDSRVVKLLRKLKDRQFIFPSNDLFQRNAKDFEQNMKKNEERNNFIVQTLNQAESSRPSLASNRLSKYSQKISLIRQMRQSTILNMTEMQKLIDDTEIAITTLCINDKQVTKHMKTLKYFAQDFQKKFQLIEDSVTESRLESLYIRGLKCLEKIEMIGPHYEDYNTGKTNFKQFSYNVTQKCSQIDKSKSKVSQILSRLSRSKDHLSRSGLDLSKSMRNTKTKQKELDKKDFVLEKNDNLLEQGMGSNHTKTITNMSNLEEDPLSSHNKMEGQGSKIQSNKGHLSSKSRSVKLQHSKSSNFNPSIASKLSPQHSEISLQTTNKNPRTSKNETAQFFVHEDYDMKSSRKVNNIDSFQKEKKNSFVSDKRSKKQSSDHDRSNSKKGQVSMSRNQSRSSRHEQSRPSAHFNEIKSPEKPREYFNDSSVWSQSSEERANIIRKQKSKETSRQGQSSKGVSHKGVQSVRDANSGSRDYQNGSKEAQINSKSSHLNDKFSKQKSRQFFSDSSYSKYDESNQEIRQAIDRSDNPDFKMVFKQPSQNSKMSKYTIQSHEHYLAVLQSLAPKSIEHQKSISQFDKQKSNSQLPHRSHFDTSSRMDNKLNGTIQKFKQNPILQHQGQSQLSKKSQKSIRNSLKSQQKSIGDKNSSRVVISDSVNSLGSKKSKHQTPSVKTQNYDYDQIAHHNQYQIRPNRPIKVFDIQGSNSKQQSSRVSKLRDSKQSILKQSKQSDQLKGTYKSSKKENQYFSPVHMYDSPPKHQKITVSTIEVIKQDRIKEIQELQNRIKQLRQQQNQLFIVRQEWKSPTRPQTLRTAISPRFRNNQTDYSDSYESFKRPNNNTLRQNNNSTQRTQHQNMNFTVTDNFKSPQGQLVYKRLYKKYLNQLDRHQKRKILKGKDLVIRNDDIEVGMMIHKHGKDLKIVYYITASRFLKSFLFRIESNSKVTVHAIPASLSNLEPKKQYRIYLFGQVTQFPYRMPEIEFKYHPSLLTIEENMFEVNQVNYFKSIIPLFFLKFFTTRQVNRDFMQRQWTNGYIFRGQQTHYSRKILPKHFYVLQYFPDLINLGSNEYETVYGMQYEYCSTRFMVKLTIKINHFFYVQGVMTSYKDRQNSQKIMEFAITCMTTLLQKNQRDIQII